MNLDDPQVAGGLFDLDEDFLSPAKVEPAVQEQRKSSVDTGVGSLEGSSEVIEKILLVDDEPNVINALKRALRDQPYEVLTATDGAEAIRMAMEHKPALVCSDMRMPGLTGVDVLQAIKQSVPDCARMLLTGYADMTSTIEAINLGQIQRYLSKPWNDDELKVAISGLLELRRLRSERDLLANQLAEKNKELQDFNDELERRVKARTAEVEQTSLFLDQANRELRVQFFNAVKVFSNMIGMRFPAIVGHSKRVAEMARAIAVEMNLGESQINDIFIAGMLHDCGKLGVTDRVLTTPISGLSADERSILMKHPANGQHALFSLPELQNASLLIRHHHERYDGQGFPDGLMKNKIPLGSRILAVAEDFDELQLGWLAPRSLRQSEAKEFIMSAAGKRYDPDVIIAFDVAWLKMQDVEKAHELAIGTSALKSRQILTRDLMTKDGILMLSAGHVVTENAIERLREYELKEDVQLKIFIDKTKVAPGKSSYS